MSGLSDGSTAAYYELPAGATELQDLISSRNMNAQDGEIFRAIYRKGRASHSDELRDAKKVLFYAQAEVARLERLKSGSALADCFGFQNVLPNKPLCATCHTRHDRQDSCPAITNAGPMLRCPDCIAEHCSCIAS